MTSPWTTTKRGHFSRTWAFQSQQKSLIQFSRRRFSILSSEMILQESSIHSPIQQSKSNLSQLLEVTNVQPGSPKKIYLEWHGQPMSFVSGCLESSQEKSIWFFLLYESYKQLTNVIKKRFKLAVLLGFFSKSLMWDSCLLRLTPTNPGKWLMFTDQPNWKVNMSFSVQRLIKILQQPACPTATTFLAGSIL